MYTLIERTLIVTHTDTSKGNIREMKMITVSYEMNSQPNKQLLQK